jgi:outer membrane protein assembly factor BamB
MRHAFAPLILLTAVAAPASDRWPQFRGPGGNGVAPADATLPERWSTGEAVRWSVEIPGHGWSSPIVWGDRVYLTSAISQGDFKVPSPGIYGNDYIAELRAQGLSDEEVTRRVRERDSESSEEAAAGVRWMVYALDAADGSTLWEREAHQGVPFGGRHRKNTYASETPVTDGERVWAYFGNVGLYCYSSDGEPLWEKRFEPRPTYLDFGTAASPLLHDGRLYVVNDNEQDGTLYALDAATGEELWRVERSSRHPLIKTGFSTPYLWRNALRTEIVVLGPALVTSYATDGRELWRLAGTSAVAAPTPVSDGELLFVASGSPSENVRPIVAIRPGAAGDISLAEGATSNEHVAWYQEREGSYITSPVVHQGRLYVLYDKGFLAAFDTATGERLFKERIGRGGATFSASPIAHGDRLFCLSESGDTFVFAAGDAYELVASSALDELSLATPAVASDSLFIRTYTRLYRVGR